MLRDIVPGLGDKSAYKRLREMDQRFHVLKFLFSFGVAELIKRQLSTDLQYIGFIVLLFLLWFFMDEETKERLVDKSKEKAEEIQEETNN